MDATKQCFTCKEIKSTALFNKDRQRKDGLYPNCKECYSAYHKKYGAKRRKERKEEYGIAATEWTVQRDYGCTLSEYKERMSSSPHCGICGNAEGLVYDHDHDTMEFRGVLCRQCNSALGKFGDTIEGVERALNYLRRHYA